MRGADRSDADALAGCFDRYRAGQDTAGPLRQQWLQIVADELSSGRSRFFVAGDTLHSFAMMSQFWSPWRCGLVGQVGYV